MRPLVAESDAATARRGLTVGDWMGSTPDVTWIMPVKNGKPYVRATLESVAAQQYGPHRIIAWDNGSSDGTQDELLAWIPSRIAGEVILDRPLPLGRCRAALVERAKSEFIACIDADDLADPRRLTVQIAYLVARPDLVALGCIPEIIDEAGAELDAWYYPESDAEIRWRSNWQTSLNASSVVFRRSAVLRAGNYRDIDFGEDLDLWMRLTALGRIENIGERLVKYRRHTQNTSVGVTD